MSLQALVQVSHAIGTRLDYVQGGGGNTSVKVDGQRMWVKASGLRLSETGETFGFVGLDYPRVRNALRGEPESDIAFSDLVQACVLPSSDMATGRPSMEAGFHAILKSAVIHTHSIYANVLTCAREGEEILADLFPGALWVDYETPGEDITRAIQARWSENNTIIFLKNHGLICTTEDLDTCMALHEDVNRRICASLSLTPKFDANRPFDAWDVLAKNVIFPDQVVYALSGDELRQSAAAIETLSAYRYIVETIRDKGLTLSCIPTDKADALRHIESERYRQGLLLKQEDGAD